MTTPASGAIAFSHVNAEVAAAAGTPRDMAWVQANTKVAAKNLNGIRSMAWFQLNGTPTVKNCTNCSNCAGAQCRDARAWLQANCNCNCTGNCQCNCDCRC